jgi:hypothetical protein
MNNVISFLLNEFNWEEFKLKIYNPEYNNAEEYELSAYQRGLHMAYGMNFIAFMSDMGYYYMSLDQRDMIVDSLNTLVDWAIDEIYNNNGWYEPAGWCLSNYSNELLPRIGAASFRLINISGIGYLCILTGEEINSNNRLNNFVMQQFWSTHNYPAGTDLHGFSDYGVTNSGMYTGGLTYANRAIYLTSLFFTALYRKTGFNIWDTDFMNEWMNQVMMRIDPQFCHFTQKDDFRHRLGLDQYKIEKGLLPFFYNNTNNPELRKAIRWYIHRVKDNNSGNYPKETNEHNTESFEVVICFNPSTINTMPISNDSYFPLYLEQGSYSNKELTILRPQSSPTNIVNLDGNYVLDIPYLIVNHENSFNHGHYNNEKTHYQLFYKGRYLIIDTGYKTWYNSNWGRTLEWFKSPYSKNLIIINPDSTYIDESDYVGEFAELTEWCIPNPDYYDDYPLVPLNPKDPIGYTDNFSYETEDDIVNPAQRHFLVKNAQMVHLKISVIYDNKMPDITGDEYPCEVFRNFYMINNNYFIIYDNIINSENNLNKYRNQIHFNPNSNEIFNSNYNSIFTSSVNNVNLFGAMGASNSFYTNYESRDQYYGSDFYTGLPLGWTGATNANHSRFRVTSTGVHEKFLTILIPSENSTNPIAYAETSFQNHYSAIIDFDTSDEYKIYTGVKDQSNDYFWFLENDQVVAESNAEFFLIETNNDFDEYRKIVLNGGNFLIMQNHFTIFDSNYEFEELLASYDNESLVLTLKTEYNDYPKYKIMRCGVEPENFQASSYFDRYINGTQPSTRYYFDHVSSLAYDNEYFYVNYSYSDLIDDELLTSELTIYQGFFNNIEINGVTQFGTGDIILKNDFTVPPGSEIVFLAGSNPQLFSNFKLEIEGTMNAIGTDEEHIVFDKQSGSNWSGIVIKDIGTANIEYCKFKNADAPLEIQGNVIVNNCIFQDNYDGILVNNPQGYIIENSIIDNCNTTGIFVYNAHGEIENSTIRNNLLTNNNSGLIFYNSSSYVEADTVYSNNYAGIIAVRSSNPVIRNSSISGTYNDNTDYPEIRISGYSYPIIDWNRNDIIFGSGYSIYNEDEGEIPDAYYCREVWWGTTNEALIEASFYPPTWEVIYQPLSQSPNVGYFAPSQPSSFEEGLMAESEGDLNTAKIKYMQSIQENPYEMEALWSANRLMNCSKTENEYVSLQQFYSQLQIDYPNTELAKLSELYEIFCNRLINNYQQAITEYEVMLEGNLSYTDSLFTQLDIVYTYLEASGSGNRGLSLRFRNSKNAITSVQEAKTREKDLWDLLNSSFTDGGIYAPQITEVKLSPNYPNPFNPSTTISFAIPEESVVKIEIFNIKGQKIKTLIDDHLVRGEHKIVWDGNDDSGRQVSSGVYFYRLEVNGKTEAVDKCLLLK